MFLDLKLLDFWLLPGLESTEAPTVLGNQFLRRSELHLHPAQVVEVAEGLVVDPELEGVSML